MDNLIWFLMMMLQNRRRRILTDDNEPRLNIRDFQKKTEWCPRLHASGVSQKVWCEWCKTSAIGMGPNCMIHTLWALRNGFKKK